MMPKSYMWTAVGIVWVRIIGLAAMMAVAFVGLDMAVNRTRLAPDDILGSVVVSLGCIFTSWALVFRTPVRVEFAGDQVAFVMPFGRRVVIDKSDVLAAYSGTRIGRFRVPGSTGTKVRLRGAPTLHISTSFIGYSELTNRLVSLARQGRRRE